MFERLGFVRSHRNPSKGHLPGRPPHPEVSDLKRPAARAGVGDGERGRQPAVLAREPADLTPLDRRALSLLGFTLARRPLSDPSARSIIVPVFLLGATLFFLANSLQAQAAGLAAAQSIDMGVTPRSEVELYSEKPAAELSGSRRLHLPCRLRHHARRGPTLGSHVVDRDGRHRGHPRLHGAGAPPGQRHRRAR